MSSLLGLAGILVALAAAVGIAVGGYAAWHWRFSRGRFLLCAFGVLACLAVVLLRVTGLAGPPPGALAAWLRLLAHAGTAILFLALLRNLARQDRAARRAASSALHNVVTSLPARSAFIAQIAPALARCRREGSPAALLAVAIDGLGEIEALRGPATAEDALRDLAATLRDTARAGDLPGHLAPTVLAALLPGTSAEAARALAERLRAQVGERLPHPSMNGSRMTVSIGIAAVDCGVGRATVDEAMDAAETALVQVMREGGDGIRLALAPPDRNAATAG